MGFDVGTRHAGYCLLEYYGRRLIANSSGDAAVKSQIHFKILHWEEWDLISPQPHEKQEAEGEEEEEIGKRRFVRATRMMETVKDDREGIILWRDRLAERIAHCPLLFEPYASPVSDSDLPIVIVENQMDQIKKKRYDPKGPMYVLANVMFAAIRAIDTSKGYAPRLMHYQMGKYHVVHGEKRSRLELKKEAVKETRKILVTTEKWDAIEQMDANKRRTGQVHDMADAFLLALQAAIDYRNNCMEWECVSYRHGRQRRRKRKRKTPPPPPAPSTTKGRQRKRRKRAPIMIIDDDEDDSE